MVADAKNPDAKTDTKPKSTKVNVALDKSDHRLLRRVANKNKWRICTAASEAIRDYAARVLNDSPAEPNSCAGTAVV